MPRKFFGASRALSRRPFFKPLLEPLERRDLLAASWLSFAHDAQHGANAPVASQSLDTIRWQTPVDLNPQYSGNDLLIHYGSPLLTPANTVIVPVKTGATGGFEVQGYNGGEGSLKWTLATDYLLPPHPWTPSYSPALTASNRLYFPGAGGTVYYVDTPDANGTSITGQVAFYNIANYTHSGFDSTVFINTPLTTDSAGDVYFGFQVTGSNPLNLQSGIARLAPNGSGTWVSAAAAAGSGTGVTKVAMNSAPALSNDQSKLYVAVSSGDFGFGYLLELDSTTLATLAKVRLKDPETGSDAKLPDSSTASPAVGPDGDVYFGVFESSCCTNNDRGWMLHFSGDLTQKKTPGAFGWDDTASMVPTSMVPSYAGSSAYLIMTKYNNYAGVGSGNGQNKIAVLDPNATMIDPVTGATVMQEVLTILGPTPDPEHPGGVREWCINTAAVDPATKSILANSEDGCLYRWDLTNNTLSQMIELTPGIGEAYTPTVVGVDGTVYAINNATLFAVGQQPGLTINDVALPEGDSGQTAFTFTVSLPNADSHSVTVNYATADGTADAGNDYVAASGTLTFPPGQTSQTVTVLVNGNKTDEPDETFLVKLSNATNAMIGRSQGVGTIINDDPHPGISIADTRITDGTSGTKAAYFTVSLTAASEKTITVPYSTADGTATAAEGDYRATTGTVTFTPGQTRKTIGVVIYGNTINEADETFFLNLGNPVNGILIRSQAVGTILNDDAALAINDVSVTDGTSGTTDATFTVTLSAASPFPVTVNYATATSGQTASPGRDFIPVKGTLTFAPNVASQTITVPVVGDLINEPDKVFYVNLSGSTNAVIARSRGIGTILDDDPAPSVSINNVTLPEGNAGTKGFVFTVSLSAPSGQTVTVPYATADGTATLAEGDYQAASGTLTFAPGIISKTITVLVNGDTVNEPDETFFINLGSPTHATLSNAQGTGTILNDDPNPLLSINNVAATEGNSGTKTFTFTVSLSAASTQTITVQYATADGTATAAEGDYQSRTGTLTFSPGQVSKTIGVVINGDTTIEPDETFVVNLTSPTNAGLAVSQGVGTILNDDLTLSINDVSVTDGTNDASPAAFTVSLSTAVPFSVTVKYATANGTAVSGLDYVATGGLLTFAPGETQKMITVLVIGDTWSEANKTFAVNLSAPTNAIISRGRGTGTILDDDPLPSLSVNKVTWTEGNSGTTSYTFTVTLSAASGQTVTVQYATADNTATLADGDYQAASGTLTFSPGQTSKTITVLVNGDRLVESDESLFVNLMNPFHATLGTAQGIGTILNDDGLP